MQTLKAVTKPTKQRKRIFQAPDHIRYKLFAATLSPELRKSHGVKTIPVRSGDTVRIMRGDHKGFEGKITRVDREKYRIYVEGLTREKVDGTTTFVPIHPSKIMITRLNLDDKWRRKILERKREARKKIEEAAEKKVPEKIEEVKEEVIEEKGSGEKEKPKRRRRKAPRKPAAKKVEKVKKEEKPKAKKTKVKRKKAAKKTEGGK
ncbi:MAG: 50S ribosomal protein L24 [Candidatus Bathycorpusculaceae bacterium]